MSHSVMLVTELYYYPGLANCFTLLADFTMGKQGFKVYLFPDWHQTTYGQTEQATPVQL